jgi:glycosyltransferase involved in cell wall biosynthesis
VSQIRFSIVITSHNQQNFIQAAVESALAQEHSSKEIIVVDDGSSDDSVLALEPYGKAIRLLILAHNLGAIESRNQGAAAARGKYLVFLDGDDMLARWALLAYDRIVAARHPKIIFGLYCTFQGAFDGNHTLNNPTQMEYVQYQRWMAKDRPCALSASTLVVERQAFQQVGGWTSGIFHLDLFDLCAKLSPTGPAVLICSPPTAFYRVHGGNSIHYVPPFIKMAHHILAKERAGEYPGSGEHRFVRYAWFGGMVTFWIKRAMRAGLYREGMKLAATGMPMILAAMARRSCCWVRGRQPVETLSLQSE